MRDIIKISMKHFYKSACQITNENLLYGKNEMFN